MKYKVILALDCDRECSKEELDEFLDKSRDLLLKSWTHPCFWCWFYAHFDLCHKVCDTLGFYEEDRFEIMWIMG